MKPPDVPDNHSSWVTVALVSLAVIFTALDQTVVVTLLPEIMLEMEISITELDQASWIITGYLLGYTIAIPLVARISDAYGHALIFRSSLIVFAVGSVLVALSPNLSWLVASRVLQAIGGGAIIPIGMVLVAQSLPGHRRAIAVGIVGAAAEIGIVLGPLYGGIITSALNWRWLFWLDVPQAAIILLTLWGIPSLRKSRTQVDYLGGLLLAATLTILVIAFSKPGYFFVSSPAPYLMALGGGTVLFALAWSQVRIADPLLPPMLFRSKTFLSAISTKLLVGASLMITMVTIPIMADTVHGQSTLEGGLRLMRLTGAVPLGALVGGYMAYRVGSRPIAVIGLLVAALGLMLISTWDLEIGEPQLSGHLAITGLGFGLVIAPLFVTGLEAGPSDYQATAVSIVTVSRMLGMALGLAALSAWGMDHFQALTTGLELPLPLSGESTSELERRTLEYSKGIKAAGISLFQSFFRIAAVLMLGGVLPALGLPSVSSRTQIRKPLANDRSANDH